MSKSADAFRTISEVADWLGVQTHVLRFWESKFTQVKPVKRAGGRRYYRPADMLLLGGIRKLLHDDGLTIKGVQKILREEGMAHVSDMSRPLDDETSAIVDTNLASKPDGADVQAPPAVPVEKAPFDSAASGLDQSPIPSSDRGPFADAEAEDDSVPGTSGLDADNVIPVRPSQPKAPAPTVPTIMREADPTPTAEGNKDAEAPDITSDAGPFSDPDSGPAVNYVDPDPAGLPTQNADGPFGKSEEQDTSSGDDRPKASDLDAAPIPKLAPEDDGDTERDLDAPFGTDAAPAPDTDAVAEQPQHTAPAPDDTLPSEASEATEAESAQDADGTAQDEDETSTKESLQASLFQDFDAPEEATPKADEPAQASEPDTAQAEEQEDSLEAAAETVEDTVEAAEEPADAAADEPVAEDTESQTPRPRIIDAPDDVDFDFTVASSVLSKLGKLRRVTPEQAAELRPLLAQLTAVRDQMASARRDPR